MKTASAAVLDAASFSEMSRLDRVFERQLKAHWSQSTLRTASSKAAIRNRGASGCILETILIKRAPPIDQLPTLKPVALYPPLGEPNSQDRSLRFEIWNTALVGSWAAVADIVQPKILAPYPTFARFA